MGDMSSMLALEVDVWESDTAEKIVELAVARLLVALPSNEWGARIASIVKKGIEEKRWHIHDYDLKGKSSASLWICDHGPHV